MPAAEISVHPDHAVRISLPWGFPLREDIAFTDARGIERRRLARRTKCALDKLQVPLRKILEPDEVVLYLARGQIMPGKPERFLLSLQSHYLSQSVLILTNRRLIDLSLKRNGQWNRNVRSARWGDIAKAEVTGILYGKLHLEYRAGTKQTYWRIPKGAARKMKVLTDVLLPKAVGENSAALAMASFCPECLAALTPRVYECPTCRSKFKNEKSALVYALLLPACGYFYVNLNLWGLLHAFIDLALFSSAFLWVLAALGRVPPQPTPGGPPGKLACFLLAGVPTAVLALEVWLAARIARNAVRKFIPER